MKAVFSTSTILDGSVSSQTMVSSLLILDMYLLQVQYIGWT